VRKATSNTIKLGVQISTINVIEARNNPQQTAEDIADQIMPVLREKSEDAERSFWGAAHFGASGAVEDAALQAGPSIRSSSRRQVKLCGSHPGLQGRDYVGNDKPRSRDQRGDNRSPTANQGDDDVSVVASDFRHASPPVIPGGAWFI